MSMTNTAAASAQPGLPGPLGRLGPVSPGRLTPPETADTLAVAASITITQEVGIIRRMAAPEQVSVLFMCCHVASIALTRTFILFVAEA